MCAKHSGTVTALHAAVAGNDLDSCELLLAAGAAACLDVPYPASQQLQGGTPRQRLEMASMWPVGPYASAAARDKMAQAERIVASLPPPREGGGDEEEGDSVEESSTE